ncbi:unnamed protein product [Strongylus vulgaris]|uniref:Uncharacterized protein n=1 Tax=Strongylus vulgaris TaxID=40348 RepID=A0A3P7JE33_STRVU|nr:unnamed protein product [Strongylus vulgaris]
MPLVPNTMQYINLIRGTSRDGCLSFRNRHVEVNYLHAQLGLLFAAATVRIVVEVEIVVALVAVVGTAAIVVGVENAAAHAVVVQTADVSADAAVLAVMG